ncbi:hypothetical protein J6A31_05285 [bacterium]|nr:hypothetical protein [bacterium]
MGRIFKFLGSNPVSFDIIPKQVEVPKPIERNIAPTKIFPVEDKFVSTKKQVKTNSFIKMRNGMGKLMSHFSKTNEKV